MCFIFIFSVLFSSDHFQRCSQAFPNSFTWSVYIVCIFPALCWAEACVPASGFLLLLDIISSSADAFLFVYLYILYNFFKGSTSCLPHSQTTTEKELTRRYRKHDVYILKLGHIQGDQGSLITSSVNEILRKNCRHAFISWTIMSIFLIFVRRSDWKQQLLVSAIRMTVGGVQHVLHHTSGPLWWNVSWFWTTSPLGKVWCVSHESCKMLLCLTTSFR